MHECAELAHRVAAVAKKGDVLFDGVIKNIERDSIVFQLNAKDRDGNSTVEEVVRRVR